MKPGKENPEIVVPAAACVFAAMAAQFGIDPTTQIYATALAVGSMGAYIVRQLRSKLSRYFAMTMPENPPQVLSSARLSRYTEEYVVRLPAGVPMSQIEKQKEAIEQYLRASVAFRFEKDMIVTVSTKEFNRTYEWELMLTVKPMEFCAGYTHDGEPFYIDIEAGPHLLIAGATGAGKSVFLRSMLTSLMLSKSPAELEIVLVDFQRVELGIFKRSPLASAFCTSAGEFAAVLSHLASESARRLSEFEKKEVVNIHGYNARMRKNRMKHILVVADEFAAMSDHRDIMGALKVRIAQDRKCGINYVICTQRPSVDIISGSIKANMPARVAFKTSSEVDSRVVLDQIGAEGLEGRGHGLYRHVGLTEFRGLFLSEQQAYRLLKPTFVEKEVAEDEVYDARPPHYEVY